MLGTAKEDIAKPDMANGCLRIVRKHAKNVLAMKTKVSASSYVLIFFIKFFSNISFILETTCKDLAKTCARYSKRGYCKTRYGKWMSKNCKKTCNKCN